MLNPRQVGLFQSAVRMADTVAAPVLLVVAFVATNIANMPEGLEAFLDYRLTVRNLLYLVVFMVLWRALTALCRLYGGSTLESGRRQTARVLAATSLAGAIALVFPAVSVTRAFGVSSVLLFWVILTAYMLLVRATLRGLLAVRPDERTVNTIIVGSGPRALQMHDELAADPAGGYHVLGFVDVADRPVADLPAPLLGSLDELESMLMRDAVDEVLIALPASAHYAQIQRTIDICERGGVAATYPTDFFRHRGSGGSAAGNGNLRTVVSGPRADDPRLLVKRAFDLLGASVGLVLAAPVLLFASLAIRLESPGPVIFVQERYGLNKRRFRMFKLRTMVADAEERQSELEGLNEATGPVFKMRRDPRQTRVGAVLRRLSIDEVPQLVNVLKGEMSLVGPRPLPLRDVSRFAEPGAMRRFSVRPGVTCLWQISGRSEVGFDRWLALDLEYIDRWTLGLDLLILLRTIPAVIRGRGAA